jgi:hypothetical protein
MKYSLFLFFVVLNLSIQGQTFPADSCDQGTYAMNTIFYSNTTSVLDSTQSTEGIYLCGPNTIVYDTLKFSGCRFVYINPGCTYISNSPSCMIFDMYFIKDNGTLIIRPDANKSEFNIYHEPLATISPSTVGCQSVTFCSALIFPPINCSVGIAASTIQESIFKIAPNPNNGSMTLQYSIKQSDQASMKIYDVTGKLVDEMPLSADTEQIQINSNLNRGIYFYQVIVNDVVVKSDKIVVIR